MDATLKAKWVEALRSGEYRQTVGSLKCGDSYCCLGVLAVLTELPFDQHDCLDIPDWDGNYETVLPLDRKDAELLYHKNDGVCGHRQHAFPEIADYIEENL